MRDVVYKLVLVVAIVWAIMGFDSGMGQFEWLLTKFPEYAMGKISFNEWIEYYSWAYGKTMHWSALVIYGLLYVGISLYLERSLNIVGSKNSIFSFAFAFFNIGIFEWFWMYGFAHFQNQWWVVSWKFPQAKILIQNVMFSIAGVFSILYFWADSQTYDENGDVIDKIYSFRFNWKLLGIIWITGISAIFWINYPYQTPEFTVEIEGMSTWQSSPKFPQTLYTIDTDITDNKNMGTWFYFENDLIHFVNTVVKTLFALCSLEFVRSWKLEK